MAITIFLSWFYLWVGALIASGYEAPEPHKTDFADRFCIAVFWLPLLIIGKLINDSN